MEPASTSDGTPTAWRKFRAETSASSTLGLLSGGYPTRAIVANSSPKGQNQTNLNSRVEALAIPIPACSSSSY